MLRSLGNRSLHGSLLSALLACGPSAPELTTGSESSSGATTTTTTTTPTSGAPESTSIDPTSSSATSLDPTTSSGSSSSDPGTSTTTTTTADPSSEDEGPPPCQVFMSVRPAKPASIALVLDKSGPMASTWDHDGDANTPAVARWSSLHDALADALPIADTHQHLGAGLVPAVTAKSVAGPEACPVAAFEVPVAPTNAAAILAAIPAENATSIKGAKPTAKGLTTALAALLALADDTPKFMLLVTSGPANCQEGAVDPVTLLETYDPAVEQVVADALALGIPTYVVGLEIVDAVSGDAVDGVPDATNPFEKLNTLAVLGGKPRDDPSTRFFPADDEEQLRAALAQILADTTSCVVTLQQEASFATSLEVILNDQQVPQVTDCASEHGWTFVDPDGHLDEIQLCGAACTAFKQIGEIEVDHFCETI